MSPKALFALKLHINSMLLNNKKFFKAISYNFGLAFFRDFKSDLQINNIFSLYGCI